MCGGVKVVYMCCHISVSGREGREAASVATGPGAFNPANDPLTPAKHPAQRAKNNYCSSQGPTTINTSKLTKWQQRPQKPKLKYAHLKKTKKHQLYS